MALFIGAVLLLSLFANPPNGETGAPGESTCSSCHSLNGNTQDGVIDLTGMPDLIEPNTQYTLTVTNSNPDGEAALAGFQVTILNSGNMKAGNITAPSAGSTTQTSAGRQYWEHNPAQMYPGSNTVTWTATWTSPSMPANTMITWYMAGNIADGSGTNNGDLIMTASGTGMLNGGGSALAVSITSSTNVLCNGQNTGSATATATGGVTPYVYSWSNGGSGTTINNLAAGTYTVTVTDNAASTATASVTITQPPLLVFNSPSITNVFCNGGNNGSITASASGGESPYFFNWSNGGSGSTISNLTAGSYTVTVTDDNECTKTATYVVSQPAVIVINLSNLEHESCDGENDGAITITVSGGVAPFFAEWSNGFIGMSISDLAPDTYSVTVTDNNDCTKTASFTINPGGVVDVTLNNITHVTCNGGNNGSISVTAIGGVPPYTYLWSNGGTTSTISGLTVGSYLVTATDSHGCAVVKGYTVNQPSAINIQIMQPTQNLCAGDSTADLTSTVTGGVGPYTSLWSNGVSGLNNSNLHAGTYTITITDASACTATNAATIVDPLQLVVTVTTTDETSVGANDGTATALTTGGTGSITYLWSNGATTPTIIGLAPGTYCITITDMNVCTATACGQVDVFGCSLDVVLGNDATICDGDSTIIHSTVMGASGTVTYLWSDGSTGDSIIVSSGDEYCLTITDGAGCQDADCITIIGIIILDLSCPVTNESAPGANDGAINCEASGIVSYIWSNGATTPGISGLAPGEYCVTITTNSGCTKAQCFNVQPGNCQMSVNSTQTNVSCNGDSTGSLILSVTGGVAPITYTWSNGNTTASNTNLAAGNYDATVSDALGCVQNLAFTITEPPALSITVDSVAPTLNSNSGLIWITANGGIPPYTYLWSDPVGANQAVEDLNNLSNTGYYAVTLTDAAGCTTSLDSIFVGSTVSTNTAPQFKALKVYPVPTNDVLIIDMETPITEALISGADGRLYKRILNPASNRLDVGELESGWYIIRISDGASWYIARMVK